MGEIGRIRGVAGVALVAAAVLAGCLGPSAPGVSDRLRAQARAATATVAASLGSRVVLDVEQGLPVAFTPR